MNLEAGKMRLLKKRKRCFCLYQELVIWRKATVQYDYVIHVDRNQYFVPYEYIKHEVDIRKVIEVFIKNTV